MDQTFSRSAFNRLFGFCAPNQAYCKLIADEDVRFARILSFEGLPMTTYLPAGLQPPQLAQRISRLDSPNGGKRNSADSVTTCAFPIIAEGVETRAQPDYLRSIDAAYAQGYYMAEPMNNQAFGRYLDSFGDRRKIRQACTLLPA